jgi:hypothetical protein
MKPAADAFKVIGLPLARLGINGKLLLPVSVDLSRRALEFQITLRANLLRDIELVRLRLRRGIGTGYGYDISGSHTVSQRRHPLDRSSSYRTKLASGLGTDPDWEDENHATPSSYEC